MSEVRDPGAFAVGVLAGTFVSLLLVRLLRGWLSPHPRCGSKMCSEPHRAMFGRCHCVLPRGHAGVHTCGPDFYLSEYESETRERNA